VRNILHRGETHFFTVVKRSNEASHEKKVKGFLRKDAELLAAKCLSGSVGAQGIAAGSLRVKISRCEHWPSWFCVQRLSRSLRRQGSC